MILLRRNGNDHNYNMEELTPKQEDDLLEEGRDMSELPDRDETPYADDPTDEELSPENERLCDKVKRGEVEWERR